MVEKDEDVGVSRVHSTKPSISGLEVATVKKKGCLIVKFSSLDKKFNQNLKIIFSGYILSAATIVLLLQIVFCRLCETETTIDSAICHR